MLLIQLDFQDLQLLEDLLSVVGRFDFGRSAHVVCLGCPDRKAVDTPRSFELLRGSIP